MYNLYGFSVFFFFSTSNNLTTVIFLLSRSAEEYVREPNSKYPLYVKKMEFIFSTIFTNKRLFDSFMRFFFF